MSEELHGLFVLYMVGLLACFVGWILMDCFGAEEEDDDDGEETEA